MASQAQAHCAVPVMGFASGMLSPHSPEFAVTAGGACVCLLPGSGLPSPVFSPGSDHKVVTAESAVPSAWPGMGGGGSSPLGPRPSFCDDLMATSWKTGKPNAEMRGRVNGLHRTCLWFLEFHLHPWSEIERGAKCAV